MRKSPGACQFIIFLGLNLLKPSDAYMSVIGLGLQGL